MCVVSIHTNMVQELAKLKTDYRSGQLLTGEVS